MAKKIDEATLAVLSDCMSYNGDKATIVQKLDRKQYTAVNEVLEACGAKWNKKAKAHVFPAGTDSAQDTVESVLAIGEYLPVRNGVPNELEFFPTPANLASDLVALLQVKDGDQVLEPSAGNGALIRALVGAGKSLDITAVEKASAFSNTLVRLDTEKVKVSVFVVDFLAHSPTKKFDAVLMNPPFSKGKSIDHVLRAFQCLKKGGRLVAVMPSSITFRMDAKHLEFRRFLQSQGGEVIKHPEGTFKLSGTGVSTVSVVMYA